jgi:hypothetical protein
MNRIAGSVAAVCGSIAAWLFWIAMGLWGVALAASDRFHGTQFLAFVPEVVWLCVSGLALGLWAVLGWVGRTEHARKRRGLRLGAAAWGAALLWVATGEWHLHRALGRDERLAGAMRVVVWNAGWSKVEDLHKRLLALNPDVVLIANPHLVTNWVALREAMGSTTQAVREGTLVCVSRVPVLEFAWANLGVAPEDGRPAWWPLPAGSSHGGEALYLRLRVAGIEEGMVVWFLDLPSDSWAWRRRVMREARYAMDAYRGSASVRDAHGRDVADGGVRAFGAPDVLVGDLNTPRGCRSVGLLAPGLRDATADAGWGMLATFPRATPILSIDRTLVSERVRVVRYATADFGNGYHLAQVIDVIPAGK